MIPTYIPAYTDHMNGTKTELGKILFDQLERMDPSYVHRSWDDLDGGEQYIYIHAIVSVIRFGEERILELLASDNEVSRRRYVACWRT